MPGAEAAPAPSVRRDLFVSCFTPTLGSGRALRAYTLVRALSRHRGVDLLYARFGGQAPDPAFDAIDGLELTETVPGGG
ncbi:MAG: hypothetical protein ACYCSI_01705, partial [Solirubrobacteraceae bacterium]